GGGGGRPPPPPPRPEARALPADVRGDPSLPGSTPIMMTSRTFEPSLIVSRSTIAGEPSLSPADDVEIRLEELNGPDASVATAQRSAPIECSVRLVSIENDAVSPVI